MRYTTIGVFSFLALLFFAGTTAAQAGLPKPGASFDTYLEHGIWTWFGDPKAIYFKGVHEKTYVSYFDITTNPGNVLVSSYDHETKEIKSFLVATNFGYDDHNHPSILVREPDHRILVFWCGHSGNVMHMRVSTNPEDVTSWGPALSIISGANGDNFTYPNPYQLSAENNRIYLFYRGIDWQQTMTWSDDGGTTWTKPFKFFAGGNRPYHKYHSNNVDEIHTVMDYDNRALPEEYLCIKKGGFYGANGQLVRTIADVQANGPITSADLPQIFIKGSTGNASVWDIALDDKGRPVFVSDSIQNGHHYYWTRWTGTKWEKHYLMNSGAEMGGEFGFACGITVDHANPNIVYLSHWVTGSNGSFPELERWITSDSGTTWAKTVVTANSTAQNDRPCVPRGYTTGHGIGLIWLYVRSYTNWFGPFDSDVKMYTFDDNPSVGVTQTKPTASARRVFDVTREGFSFVLGDPAASSLKIYSIAGRLVSDLSARVRSLSSGSHVVALQKGALPQGAYVARFATSANQAITRTFVISK
jgi:hypothetical protein